MARVLATGQPLEIERNRCLSAGAHPGAAGRPRRDAVKLGITLTQAPLQDISLRAVTLLHDDARGV